MKPTPLQVARALWNEGAHEQAIRTAQGALEPAQLGPWLTGILEAACAGVTPVPEEVRTLLAVSRDPERWSEGHACFDRLRPLLIEGERRGASDLSALLHLAELTASILYNLARQPAPFDATVEPAYPRVLAFLTHRLAGSPHLSPLAEVILRADGPRAQPPAPEDEGPGLRALVCTAGLVLGATGGVVTVRRFDSGAVVHRLVPARVAAQSAQSLRELELDALWVNRLDAFSAGTDGQLRRWDLARGGLSAAWTGHAGPVTSLSGSADGRTLLSCAGTERTLCLWDLSTGLLRERIELGGPLLRARVGSAELLDAEHALVAGTGGSVVWSLTSGRAVQVLAHPDETEQIEAMAVSRRGQWIATVGTTGTIVTWAYDSKHAMATFSVTGDGSRSAVRRLLFAPEGRLLFAGGEDGQVRVFSPIGDRVMLLPGTVPVRGLCLGGAGELVVGDANGAVKVWDLRRGTLLRELEPVRAPG